jgi:hypothetical protein
VFTLPIIYLERYNEFIIFYYYLYVIYIRSRKLSYKIIEITNFEFYYIGLTIPRYIYINRVSDYIRLFRYKEGITI